MKKTNVKNVAGGTKKTVTNPDGSITTTYNGVSNLHIGRIYGASNSFHVPSNQHWKQQQPSSSTNFSSTVMKGVTFKRVDSLHLNPKEVKMLSSKEHKTYASVKDYEDSQATSSKNEQPQQSASSFKR